MSIATHRVGRIRVDAFMNEDRVEIARSNRPGTADAPFGHLDLKYADVDDLIHALQGVPNTQRWQRVEDAGVEAGYLVAWLQQIAADGAIAGSADAAQLLAIADAVLGHQHRSQIEGVRIHEDMSSIGVGPTTFDMGFAKDHGWTEFDRARCWQIVAAVTRSFSRMVAARKGHTRICQDCEQWTVPDGECHLCAADPQGMKDRCAKCKHLRVEHADNNVPGGCLHSELGCTCRTFVESDR